MDVGHIHNTLSRLTITPKGVAFLAKHGHFIDVPMGSIRDKSKADVLAKGLVCLQVGWLLLETVSRKAVGYPITLLELHVLVHCACAIAMYGLWFHKPMDVRDPILVDSSNWNDLLALMLVRNYGLGSRGCKNGNSNEIRLHAPTSKRLNGAESAYIHVYTDFNKGPELPAAGTTVEISAIAHVDELSKSVTWIKHGQPSHCTEPENTIDPSFSIKPAANMELICTLASGQCLDCGFGPSQEVVPTAYGSKTVSDPGNLKIALTLKDVRRWKLASVALEKYGGELHKPGGSVNYLVSHAPNIFLDRHGVQAGFYSFFCSWASGGLVAALSVCCFYGATHTLAWNFLFPTPVERLLWRIASIDVIAGAATVLALFSVVVYLHEHEKRSLIISIVTKEAGVLPILFRVLIFIGLINVPLFLFSRIFIVFESFFSLRRVPVGVYTSIQWSRYIPCLS